MKNLQKHFLKRMLALAFAILFSLIMNGQEAGSFDTQKFRVKFNEQQSRTLDQSTVQMRTASQNRYARTGIASVDNLNSKHQVQSLRRMFPDAGKFEERHRRYGLHLWYIVDLNPTPGSDIMGVISEFRNDQNVSVAEPIPTMELYDDWAVNPNFVPDDPQINQQWHYNNTGQTGGTPGADIDLFAAWDIERGDSNVIVAIIDGGIELSHSDLSGSLWTNFPELYGTDGVDDDGNGYIDDIHGYSFVNGSANIVPHYHGTHVAGTVAARINNATGVAGIAGGSGANMGVKLMSCAVFQSSGGGFAEAFVYAADNGAVIAQNSWGRTTPGSFDLAQKDAIDYFIANAGYDEFDNPVGPMQGGLVLFAAGNNNSSADYYPAYYDKVMAVASTDHNDIKSYFSNFGDWIEISAPGSSVWSTYTGNNYSSMSGTSMACPHVSGVAALIVSQFGGIGYNPQQVWDRLVNTTEDIDLLNPYYTGLMGSGRLNAFQALLINDSIPPDPISDLTVHDVGSNFIALNWTATGASADSGVASYYDIRYADFILDSSNFETAIQLAFTPSPSPSGTKDSVKVPDLFSDTDYYVALKAIGLLGNTSGISNIAFAHTLPPPVMVVTPDSINVQLMVGDEDEEYIIIDNTAGASVLEVELSVEYINTDSLGSIKSITKNILSSSVQSVSQNNPTQERLNEAENILVIQNSSAWGIDLYTFILDNFGILSDVINSDNIAATDFSNYQLIITVGDESSTYYNTISANVTKFEEFTNNGGVVQYQLATHGDDVSLAGGADMIYGSLENTNLGILLDHPLLKDAPELLTGNSANHGYLSNLPGNALIITETQISGLPTTVEYSLGEGMVIATGMTWEFLYYNNFASGIMLYNALAYSISNAGLEWIQFENNQYVIPSGTSISIPVKISAAHIDGGVYHADIIIQGNDPINPESRVHTMLNAKGVPRISINPDTLNFGSIYTNISYSRNIAIINSGSDLLLVDTVYSTNPNFQLDTNNIEIGIGYTVFLEVEYSSAIPGSDIGELIIISNANTDSIVNVRLLAECLEPPVILVVPDSFNIDLNIGDTLIQQLTIDNTLGASDLLFDLNLVSSTSFLNSIQEEALLQRISLLGAKNILLENKQLTFTISGEDANEGVSEVYNYTNTSLITNEISGTHVLFISAYWSAFQVELEARGAITSIYTGEIDQSILDSVDVLVIDDNLYATTAEISLINAWINSGGSLLIDADQVADEKNQLIEGSGITYQTTHNVNSLTTEITDHFVTKGITNYQINGCVGSLSVTGDAIDLIRDTIGIPHAAVAELGKGRVFAICDESFQSKLGATGHLDLGINAINWLSASLNWIDLFPKSGNVPAGSTLDVDVKYDSRDNEPGEYSTNILVSSNDPVNPEINVPVRLNILDSQKCYDATFTSQSGTFSDKSGSGNYFNNMDCRKLIQPVGAVTITLNFTSFNTESGYDFVNVYDGDNTGATLLGKFSGTALPPFLTSSGGSMLVQFTSDESVTALGWEAEYTSSDEYFGPCIDETFTEGSGTLNDNSGPGNYLNDMDCRKLIQPAGVASITLTFTAFDTEQGYDIVFVYDGETTSDPLLGSYSGSSLPPDLTSSGGSMLVRFVSDGSVIAPGWEATYASVLEGACTDESFTENSGTVDDNSGIEFYFNNADCYKLIQPVSSDSIKLNFTAFNTEPGNDIVFVYDGSTTSDPLIGSFSGTGLPPELTAYNGSMLIRFVSNESDTMSGWSADYTSYGTYTGPCIDESFTAETGTIDDNSGPDPYFNDMDCRKLIQVAGATSISLNFTSFNTESGYDFVNVYDGDNTGATLLGKFSGTALPPVLTSSGGSMLVRFTSDGSVTAAGWEAEYTSSDEYFGPCIDQILTEGSGTFNDNSGPGNYLNDMDCRKLIQPAGVASITLTFTAFDTEQGYDIVFVYDGETTSDPLLGSYSGSSLPPDLTSSGGSMLVRFTSDGSVTAAGWEAEYTSSDEYIGPCIDETFTEGSGTLNDNSGPGNYANDMDCRKLIQPAGVASITLTFTAFDTEQGYDIIHVYDGETISDPLLGSYSGSSLPPDLTSSGGSMLVRFVSDYSVTAQGWEAEYVISGSGSSITEGSNKSIKNLTTFNANNTEFKVSIYPNPTDGELIVELNTVTEHTLIYEVVNSNGTTVLINTLSASEGMAIVDMSGLSNGVYILRILNNEFLQTFRVVLLQE